MRRSNGRQLVLLGFLGCIPLFNSPFALGAHVTGFVDTRTFPKPPSTPKSPEKFDKYFSCYDAHTGKRLNCPLTYSAVGVEPPESLIENNGGHVHANHPLLDTASTDTLRHTLQFSSVDQNPSPLVVQGSTQNTEVRVTHPLPQIAGKIVTETRLFAPPGWYCVAECFTHNSWKYKWTFDIGIEGLTELTTTGNDDFAFKPRPGDTHPSAHFGTAALLNGIKVISGVYKGQTDRRPRITDMSLPKGGVFDLNNQWFVDQKNGHVSHRIGEDVDFSAVDDGGQSINCFLQHTKKMITAFLYAKAAFKKCYDDGHYHIRFP